MIFHCAADAVYIKQYFPLYYSSIKRYNPDAKFSLNALGTGIPSMSGYRLKVFTQEPFELKAIKKLHGVKQDRDALGFLAFNRWTSLPEVTEPLVVSDVDIAAINPVDSEFVQQTLEEYPVIQVTRITRDTSGGVVMFILHPEIITEVREFARQYLKTTPLTWDLDLGVLNYFQKTYKICQTLNLRAVTKNADLTDDASWFIYSKGKERKHGLLHSAWNAAHPDCPVT